MRGGRITGFPAYPLPCSVKLLAQSQDCSVERVPESNRIMLFGKCQKPSYIYLLVPTTIKEVLPGTWAVTHYCLTRELLLGEASDKIPKCIFTFLKTASSISNEDS